VILGLLAGCGGFGLSTPVDPTPATLALAAVDPAWGPPDEETSVTLTGTALDTVTKVTFGSAEVDFTVVDAETIVATTPAPGFETVVDVSAYANGAQDTLEEGFAFTNDAPEGDTDTDVDADTDTDTSGVGKTGGYLHFELAQYTCPQCYSPALSSSTQVVAEAVFHDPTRTSWLDWLPADGDCVTDPDRSLPASTFLDAGDWIYLNAGSQSVGLQADSSAIYAGSGLEEPDFVRNAAYDLSVPTGGRDLDAFDMVDVLVTPQVISTLTPTDILLTSPRDLFTAQISRRGPTFTWGPAGGTSSFVIDISVFAASSGEQRGEVVCRGPDNGTMTIPSTLLSGYDVGSLLIIGMYRYSVSNFERPDNGSSVDTLATVGVVGTGSLSP
jgi:hypothetical protein